MDTSKEYREFIRGETPSEYIAPTFTGLRPDIHKKITGAARKGRTGLLVQWDELTNKDIKFLESCGMFVTLTNADNYRITWDTFWFNRDMQSTCCIV